MIVWLRRTSFFALIYGSAIVIGFFGLPTFLLPGRLGRQSLRLVIHFWTRMTRLIFLWIYGVESELRNAELLPEGPCLIAMKHQSAYDTMFPVLWLSYPVFVLKVELAKIFGYGWYCRKSGMIAIDRSGGLNAMRKMCRQAQENVQEGAQILIFPEGTRRSPYDPPRYLSGVMALYKELGIPCVPIALNSGMFWPSQTHSILNRKKLPKPLPNLVFQVLPSIEAGLSRDEFMRRLQAALEPAALALREESITHNADDGEQSGQA